MIAHHLLALLLGPAQGYGVAPEEWSRLGALDGHGLGSCLAVIGDRDGDERPDLLVGAPGTGYAGTDRGSVYILSSRNGDVLLRVDGITRDGGFGLQAAPTGDLDGDGREDFLASEALYDGPGLTDSGRVAVYSSRDGSILFERQGAASFEYLGILLSGGSDITGDGVPDFVVCNQRTAVNPSWAFIYSGATFLSTLSIRAPLNHFTAVSSSLDLDGDARADVTLMVYNSAGNELRAHSGRTGNLFYSVRTANVGNTIAPMRDLDLDGIGEIVTSVRDTSATILSGANGAVIRTILNDENLDGFGDSVAGIGDFDWDGHPDLAVGAPQTGTTQASHVGAVALYSGHDGRHLFTVAGTRDGGEFGANVASLGDLDGDDASEWAASAPLADNRGYADAGMVAVMSYRAGLRCRQSGVSAAFGGPLDFLVNLGPAYTDQPYLLLASATGPGNFSLGVDVPLTLDDWVVRSLDRRYPPQFVQQGFAGLLDAWGRAKPTARVPASALSGRVGSSIAFAAIVYPALGAPLPEAASQAVEILVLP